MWENAGKMRTRITPNTDTFYAVILIVFYQYFTTVSIIDEIIIDNNDNNNNKKVSDAGVSLGLFEVFQNFFFSVWVFLHLKSTNRNASGKREVSFNSSLPLSPASRTLTHYPVDYCRELTLRIASDRTCTGNS